MRIAGMASGMDIDQIVRDLMKAERIPVDKMKQEKQVIEWKMQDYREINRKLSSFHTNIFDTVMRSANMTAKKVTSSNESRVSATALSTTGNVSMRISEITKLARAASYNSEGDISTTSTKVSASEALGTQPLNFNDPETGDSIWKSGIVNRENVVQSGNSNIVDATHLNIDGNYLDDMIVKVNGKVYNVLSERPEGRELADNEVLFEEGFLEFKGEIASNTTVALTFITEAPPGSDDPKHKYTTAGITTYNEKGQPQKEKFIFTSDQSLNTVFNEIGRSNIGVTAFYDEHTGRVNFSRKETGVFNADVPEIEFEGSFLTSSLRLNINPTITVDGEEVPNNGGAQNAVFTLNGLPTERRSNTFSVSGITVTLKSRTEGDEVITLNASTDTDKVFNTIKKFVDEYNELLDFVNGKMTEERFRDYKPLTDEQKDALSEKEVERWEERARSGLLRNDAALRNQFDRMRIDMYSPVSGALDSVFKQLSAIGITTTSNYNDRGKLEINEDKLRAAIDQDAEGVFQLFTADGNSFEEKGIARRVRSSLDNAITALADRAGGFKGKNHNHSFTLGRNLNTIESRISDFERRLKQVEDRYWRQFNAMDSAVNKANQQAETLFAQLFPQG
jgi:flagellar hook-associated protein 2